MALATQCPHCHTKFRVAADQLKLRGGIVRCGACQAIFDGSAHLIDLEAQARMEAEEKAAAAAAAPVAETVPADEAAPEDDPAFDSTFDRTFDHTVDARSALPQPAEADVVDELAVQIDAPPSPLAERVEPRFALPEADDDAAYVEATEAELPPQDGEALDDAPGPVDEYAPVDASLEVDDPAPVDESEHEAAEPDFAAYVAPEPAPADTAEPVADPAHAAAPDFAAYVDPGTPSEPALDAPPKRHPTIRGDDERDDGPAAAAPDATPWPELDLEPYPEPTPTALLETETAPESAAAAEPDAAPASAVTDDDAAASPALPLRASAGDDDSEALAVAAAAAAAAAPPARSARTKAADARARRSKLTPTPIDETPKLRVPETDEPEFVKRSRRKERASRAQRIAMGAGSAVLLLLLGAQGVLEFRNVLAARFPASAPLLSAVCAPFGCRVSLPAQVDSLAIETGELSPLGPDTYSLNTLLRNQGSLVQAWPSIELELVDDNNKALLRRVFVPADYLPQASIAAGFAARSEQPVRLDFVLAGVKPAGYHLFVFYP